MTIETMSTYTRSDEDELRLFVWNRNNETCRIAKDKQTRKT